MYKRQRLEIGKYTKFKKVPIFNFFCDNAYLGDTEPTEAGEVKSFKLAKLMEMYPSKLKELKEKHGEQLNDNIEVWEMYKKGKAHIIFTEELTLLFEYWEDKPLPYQLLKWEEADQGVVGVGLAKKLYQTQRGITYIMGKTFTSIRNFAVPRIFIPKGASPTRKDVTNTVAEIIELNSMGEGKTGAPIFSTPPAINDQVLNFLDMLWTRSFEIVGISSLSAGGRIPRGLEKASGAAMRSYQQVESERFQLIRASYEETFVQMAKTLLKLSPENKLPISKKELEDVKDHANIWTKSLLPETPSGRLAMVGDLFNTGMVKGDQALSLLNSPDTNKFLNSNSARLRAVDLILDRAIEKGKKPMYHPELGLDLFLDRARKLFAEVLIEDEESPKIPLLKACIEELTRKVAEQSKIDETINQMSGQNQPPPKAEQLPYGTEQS